MEDYLSFAKKLSEEMGTIMLKYFKLGLETNKKKDRTPVTEADLEINNLVIKKIENTFPDHSIYGEEKSVDKKSKKVWVCDPIDGTVPFSMGIPVSVFSLAFVEDGKPIVGVVYDPFTKRLYRAEKGKGAFMNDKKISVSKLKLGYDATLSIDWWSGATYDTGKSMHEIAVDTESYIFQIGTIVNASCLVAAGQYEACLFPGTKGKCVDIAAIKVIVEEAGGKVTSLFGAEQRYDGDIQGAMVSNGIVHDELLKYTSKLKPKKIVIEPV